MVTQRLPEWRYEVRRTVVGLIAVALVIGTIALTLSLLGLEMCAEDFCYQLPATQ